MRGIEYPKREDWSEILKRPTQTVNDIETMVNQIFEDVDNKFKCKALFNSFIFKLYPFLKIFGKEKSKIFSNFAYVA